MANKQEGFNFDKEIPHKEFVDDPTPAYMLHRRDGPDTSKAAAYQVKTTKMEQVVYEAVCEFPDGAWQDIVLDYLEKKRGLKYGNVTPRFSALIRKGFIFDTGKRVKGNQGRMQRVVMATKFRKDHN